MSTPDTSHGGFAHSRLFRHAASAPLRGVGGFARRGQLDNRRTLRFLIVRPRPGRRASVARASFPHSGNRFRHRAAFSGVMPSSAAISRSCSPSAARRTMRERSTVLQIVFIAALVVLDFPSTFRLGYRVAVADGGNGARYRRKSQPRVANPITK